MAMTRIHARPYRFHHHRGLVVLLVLFFLFLLGRSLYLDLASGDRAGWELVYPSGPVESEEDAVRLFQEYLNRESVDPQILAGNMLGLVSVSEYSNSGMEGWIIVLGDSEFLVSREGGVYKRVSGSE